MPGKFWKATAVAGFRDSLSGLVRISDQGRSTGWRMKLRAAVQALFMIYDCCVLTDLRP